jgi:hypothetical protein
MRLDRPRMNIRFDRDSVCEESHVVPSSPSELRHADRVECVVASTEAKHGR